MYRGNMHEGHRQRLYAKLEEGDNLYEHELLEILLFNAYPRRDVNPIAHALLARFASINEILAASVNELCAVEGVGRNVALYLKCIGRCVSAGNGCDSFAIIKTTEQFKKFLALRYRGKNVEVLEMYFMDKSGRVKRISSFSSNDTESVQMPSEEIARLISVYQPYGLFVAHNHVRYHSCPSLADDEFTKRLQLICSLNNVRLYDHCIYASDDDIFSYYLSNRIDEIKSDYSLASIIKNGK
jgi:DNA repair protein RadC